MRIPKLRVRADGRYVVAIKRQDIYLGRDKAEAELQYHRLMVDFVQHGGILPEVENEDRFLCELIEAYLIDRKEFYKDDLDRWPLGMSAMRYLNKHFGHYKVSQFGMRELRRLREEMLKPTEKERLLCRSSVNRMVREVASFWRWCAEMELAPAEIHARCAVLRPLKHGHSTAPETQPVTAVPIEHIEKVKALVNRSVAALIDLQLLTGARSGEILDLKAEDIDRSGEVWTVILTEHKTAHKGKKRVLYFGERAQAVLKPFLLMRRPGEYLFQPGDYIEDVKANRKGDGRRPDQMPNPRKTERTLGDHYDHAAYRRAIARACVAAKVPHWHPHQLRHTAATEVRKAYGLEAARAMLGHSHVNATEIYAEVDAQIASKIAKEMG